VWIDLSFHKHGSSGIELRTVGLGKGTEKKKAISNR
jgi:hypothetical protein